ncbi:uncharacterized protein [Choristoneura fumiferana]|uniref:uncharacterized protein n=1 Tax=Choristoneura fumiferana TaxID=7141 RepID=UPI003D158038
MSNNANTPFFGTIASFDHEQQDWTTYISRLKQWFIANKITEETDKLGVQRRAILLSAFTEATYQLANNLVLPKSLEDVSYGDIITSLDKQFTPKRCGFAERHHFYAAQQRPGESHPQWAARLRGLAAHCKFKDLEEHLLDKFVVGMLPCPEREKLYTMEIEDLTLAKAVDTAASVQCARKAAVSASAAVAGGDTVFKIGKGSKPTTKTNSMNDGKCLVCGSKNHKSSECRFASYKCKKCKNKGHLRRMCKSVNFVETDEGSEGDDVFTEP